MGIKKNHELFQGRRIKPPYFEGWYFKQVDLKGRIISFIPGIQKTGESSSCFIQIIYGNPPHAEYLKFDYDSFEAAEAEFEIKIGNSIFSDKKVIIDQTDESGNSYSGELLFSNLTPLKKSFFNPGIMGWYHLVPMLECNHGMLSADHDVNGSLLINGDEYLFNSSRGYIEKDWGSSFPESWIWTQSNSFEGDDITSAMLSIARVPWLGRAFTGYLGFVYYRKQMYRFGTYTGHRIIYHENTDDYARINFAGKDFSVYFSIEKGLSGVLKAPSTGAMSRDIEESTAGKLTFELIEHSSGNEPVIKTSYPAAVEIVGDMDLLLGGL